MISMSINYFHPIVKRCFQLNKKTKRIAIASLFAVLICLATMIITIPSPLKGYFNLGDAVVLLAALTLSPAFGFLAAGIGSALADLFSGYVIYAPATFLIKGMMVLIAFGARKFFSRKIGMLPSLIIGGLLAELFMILGYFLFEGALYGFVPSLVNIPANGVQAFFGLILGVVLKKIFEKTKIKLD